MINLSDTIFMAGVREALTSLQQIQPEAARHSELDRLARGMTAIACSRGRLCRLRHGIATAFFTAEAAILSHLTFARAVCTLIVISHRYFARCRIYRHDLARRYALLRQLPSVSQAMEALFIRAAQETCD